MKNIFAKTETVASVTFPYKTMAVTRILKALHTVATLTLNIYTFVTVVTVVTVYIEIL